MSIFKTLAIGLKRSLFSHSIPRVAEYKSFGNHAEGDVTSYIKKAIPKAIVKTNVMVETDSGSTEIDCLVLYNKKIFLIEIKHWIGTIIEKDGRFYSFKEDKYTDDIHQKEVKSPFNQIKRQIRLLKEMTDSNPWINPIVFFVDTDNIKCDNKNIWFDNIHKLVIYIYKEGHPSYQSEIQKFMPKIKSSDFISSSSSWYERNLHCLIDEETLEFNTDKGLIHKKDISTIQITHHFSYDELDIKLKNGKKAYTKVDNSKITALEGGIRTKYSLAKINNINIGE